MKLTYIYHSCFAIEADEFSVIIDFFKDTLGDCRGYIHDKLLRKTQPLYVLSSHSHADHFNPVIFDWKSVNPNIHYVLSSDICSMVSSLKGIEQTNVTYMDKLESYSDRYLDIKAFGSTDLGISFLMKCGGKKIFHAGDLNNWHWNEESTAEEIQGAEMAYLTELNLLKEETNVLDLAMFPIDPRLGKNYMIGAQQFVDNIQVGLFAPMHFGEEYDCANSMATYAESKGCKFFTIKDKGDNVLF